jgi:hypothetical protein
MVDMRGNLVMGLVVALVGAVLVRSMKSPARSVARRRWIPAIALISGPLLTVGWCVVDAYYVSQYAHPDDFVPTVVSAVVIGLVAGAIGATAFWLAER